MTRLPAYLRTRKRWGIVVLLFFVAMVNHLDRQALSVLAGNLKTTLGFGNIEYSDIVSSFLTAYAIGYAFCGYVPVFTGLDLRHVTAFVVLLVSMRGAGRLVTASQA